MVVLFLEYTEYFTHDLYGESRKVFHTLSHCKGLAEEWATSAIINIGNDQAPEYTYTFFALAKELQQKYGDPNRILNAGIALMHLKMNENDTVLYFRQKVERLAA